MAAAVLVLPARASGADVRVSTTVYVNRYFEVRDHDQPVKYLFNGDTRIAAITGSLSLNSRIQRLRLHSGWNLLSLAVNATNALAQFNSQPASDGGGPMVSAMYQWLPASGDYAEIGSGQTLPAEAVLWVKARTNATVAISGTYADPKNQPVDSGGAYVAGTGLEAWSPNLPPTMSAWTYDADSRQWHDRLPGALTVLSDPPPTLAPGEATYVDADAPGDLGIPDPDLRVHYYHQDHLGSSSVITDASGSVVEETAFHPSGVPRNQYRPRQVEEPYQFTQKERDPESGLHYFETRFLAGPLSRFVSADLTYAQPDLLSKEDMAAYLAQPQRLNLYSYVRNNPLTCTDPTGQDTPKSRTKAPPQAPAVSTLTLSGVGDIKFESVQFASERQNGADSAEPNPSGTSPISRGMGITITRYLDELSPQLFREAGDGKLHDAVVTLRTKGGEPYLRIKLTGVMVSHIDYSDGHGGPNALESVTFNAAKVEFIQSPQESAAADKEAEHGSRSAVDSSTLPEAKTAKDFNEILSGRSYK